MPAVDQFVDRLTADVEMENGSMRRRNYLKFCFHIFALLSKEREDEEEEEKTFPMWCVRGCVRLM